MQSHRINIVIVDDHPIVIEGLKIMLSDKPFFHISETFTHGSEVAGYIRTNEVDIVLLDISLPDISGIQLCEEIKKISPTTSVIMFSNRSERSIIMQCIQNGASGYLLKNVSLEELMNCFQGALSGNIVFCNETKNIISRPSPQQLNSTPRLTKRETQILQFLAKGKTSHEIADELCLSPLTVDTHRKNLLSKFNAKNSAELVNRAMQQHLILE